MDLIKSIAVAASGLRSQSGRMRVISENIANADSGPERAGAEPYRRKVPTFQRHFSRELDAQLVALGKVQRDQSAFKVKHEPGNPAADAKRVPTWPVDSTPADVNRPSSVNANFRP